jgi:hypothetical protein
MFGTVMVVWWKWKCVVVVVGDDDDSRTFPNFVGSEIDRPSDATSTVGMMFVVDDDTCWVMVVVTATASS